MAQTQTFPWDVTEHWETSEDIAIYLEAVSEDGDTELIALAMGEVARAIRDTELIPAAYRDELISSALALQEKAQAILGAELIPVSSEP